MSKDKASEQDDFEISLGVAPPPDEVTGTNAGDDAVMGTIAEEPPDDPDNPDMHEGLDPDPSIPVDPPPEIEE